VSQFTPSTYVVRALEFRTPSDIPNNFNEGVMALLKIMEI